MKEYIVVSEEVAKTNLGLAVCSIAHAALVAHGSWDASPTDVGLKYQEWLQTSFKKVVCVVPDEVLSKLMLQFPAHVKVTESALDHRLVSVVFHPIYSNSNSLNCLPLFK